MPAGTLGAWLLLTSFPNEAEARGDYGDAMARKDLLWAVLPRCCAGRFDRRDDRALRGKSPAISARARDDALASIAAKAYARKRQRAGHLRRFSSRRERLGLASLGRFHHALPEKAGIRRSVPGCSCQKLRQPAAVAYSPGAAGSLVPSTD